MGRPELHEAVDNRDLEYLNEQFNIYVLEQPAWLMGCVENTRDSWRTRGTEPCGTQSDSLVSV